MEKFGSLNIIGEIKKKEYLKLKKKEVTYKMIRRVALAISNYNLRR